MGKIRLQLFFKTVTINLMRDPACNLVVVSETCSLTSVLSVQRGRVSSYQLASIQPVDGSSFCCVCAREYPFGVETNK